MKPVVDSDRSSTVALRGHHLLCLLPYCGKGYSQEFVANFTRIAEAITGGAKVVLVEGPDDVCAALGSPSGKCSANLDCKVEDVSLCDALALKAVNKQFKFSPPLVPGSMMELTSSFVDFARKHFANGTIREACAGCGWHNICSNIAEEGFRNAKLFPLSLG
ncbi:MAG: DUF1284 domain-containing protein [Bdellovibrionales bacterium]